MSKGIFRTLIQGAPLIIGAFACIQLFSVCAAADGMDEPVRRAKPVVRAEPRYEAPIAEAKPVQAPARIVEPAIEPCDWRWRLSPGGTVWFFKDENNLFGPALYADVWRTDIPLNYRMGVEGRHMYLGQEAADFAREAPDKTTRVTFIRIPFAVEYMHRVNQTTTWFLGGGPDILHTANDLEDTSVGGHLGSRLHYAFNDRWGMAIEGGYMWGRVDGLNEDVKLDNAYVTPTLSYTF